MLGKKQKQPKKQKTNKRKKKKEKKRKKKNLSRFTSRTMVTKHVFYPHIHSFTKLTEIPIFTKAWDNDRSRRFTPYSTKMTEFMEIIDTNFHMS